MITLGSLLGTKQIFVRLLGIDPENNINIYKYIGKCKDLSTNNGIEVGVFLPNYGQF
jgi:hypothetical protein